MRRALIVGIDHFDNFSPLYGCRNDAREMEDLLSKNEDGSPNFACMTFVSGRGQEKITRKLLRGQLKELFGTGAEVALFYFAGHGDLNVLGGHLVTEEADTDDEGVEMDDVLALANKSSIKEVVIILDCCHSGAFGRTSTGPSDQIQLREGLSVLVAARPEQLASEKTDEPRGLFTSLLGEALRGGAADVRGRVTAASMYAFVDQALGAWNQRPMFQAHIARQLPLRQCVPTVDDGTLRRLAEYFPEEGAEFDLDPSYDPDLEPKNEENEVVYTHLQAYRDARLLVPVGEEYLYYAAKNEKSCKLTPLGEFYRKLAVAGRL